jgi:hypothetical protein
MTTAYYCGHPMRDGPCNMRAGHRGRHTTVAFYCDVCGTMRRGTPVPIRQRISPYDTEHVADACFVCTERRTP